MSDEQGSMWIGLAEKLFGLILIIISGILLYFTLTSTSTLIQFAGLFGFLAVVMLIAGILLIIIKPPE